jgi:superfamily II DNA or RNA helicase
MDLKLHDWQEEALKALDENNFNGTIKAVTGVGKTVLGLACIESLMHEKVVIAVHTEHLQDQWRDEIIEHGVASEDDISFVGGGSKDISGKIVIGIINTLRDMQLSIGTLILDESHHYGSEQNSKIVKYWGYKHLIAFSATPERQDGEHKIVMSRAPIIYEFGKREAIANGLLSKYDLINKSVWLTPEESVQLSMIEERLQFYMPIADFNALPGSAKTLVTKRRQLLLHAHNKATIVLDIVGLHCNELTGELPKTIVFTEYIKTANKIFRLFEEKGVKVALYHSKVSLKERKQMIEDFKNDKFMIMIAVKALDEGINVPSCELGIIVGGTTVKRQAIQRLGRILRQQEGKVATLYQLYVKGTADERWMRNRNKVLVEGAKNVRYE